MSSILADDLSGFDTVLSFLGTNALAFQPGIIDAAIAAGVTSFYPSEYGADLSQAPFATNRFFRDKTITRDYLEARTKGLPKFHYTYIVTGVFAEFLPSSFFGIDPQKHEFTFYGDPEGKVALTSTAEYAHLAHSKSLRIPFHQVTDNPLNSIAKYTVASVLLSQDSQSRTFKIPTSAYTWTSLINMISRIQNVPYESHSRSLSEVNALQEEAAKRGDEDAEMLYAMRGALGIPIEPVPRPWDHDKFSFEPVDLETSLRNVLGA